MKRAALMAGALVVSMGSAPLHAAFRAGDHPALQRPAPPPPQSLDDAAVAFSEAYAQAGRPAIALLWGRRLSDQTETTMEDRTTVTESGGRRRDTLDKTSQGLAETARIGEEDERSNSKRTTVHGTYAAPAADAGGAAPTSRHAAVIEHAFLGEMRRAGVRFVDRAVAMRTTAATRHRNGGDRQLIETDALLDRAQLLMEVLWIEDKDAPAGHAFEVRTKRLRDGLEVASVYSRGAPPAPPRGQARWVAGGDGYELQQPPPPPAPSPAQVGHALARDVMRGLAMQLERDGASPRSKR